MINHYASSVNQQTRGALREFSLDYHTCVRHAAERLLKCRGTEFTASVARITLMWPRMTIWVEGLWDIRFNRPARRRP